MRSENLIQFFKFALVGCVNTFVDWAAYFTIISIFPAESTFFYAVAKGFSYFCGIVNSFFLNRCWTFNAAGAGNEGGRFVKFALVNAIGLGINSLTIYECLKLNISQIMALFMATAIAFGFNFTLTKIWVFRKDKMVAKTTGG